jgi:hypothetical protein
MLWLASLRRVSANSPMQFAGVHLNMRPALPLRTIDLGS